MELHDNKELCEKIESIGRWASEDNKRVAFVVCGEITEDGIKTSNSLVGRTDRIARAMFGNAMEIEDYKKIIMLTSSMLDNPLAAMLLCMEAAKDEKPDKEPKGGLVGSFKELLDALKDKIRND